LTLPLLHRVAHQILLGDSVSYLLPKACYVHGWIDRLKQVRKDLFACTSTQCENGARIVPLDSCHEFILRDAYGSTSG
jgi:hypothetical protein